MPKTIVVSAVPSLVTEHSQVSVRVPENTLRDEVKKSLGKQNWQKVEKRISK